jgi:beta-alanine degradation protein BauB
MTMHVDTECQIENSRTRVIRYRLVPGASIGFHRHAHDYVIVPITSGRLCVIENGRESIAELTSGIAYFRSAGVEHDVGNAGSQDMIFIAVERIISPAALRAGSGPARIARGFAAASFKG